MTLEFLTTPPLVPSASVCVANQDSLKARTLAAFGGIMPPSLANVDKSRFRGDFMGRDTVWGLRQTTSDIGQPFSTAVALTGSEVVFYIEPMGNGVGYLRCARGRVVFTRTILNIEITNLLEDTSVSLEFRGFSDPAGSPSRYVRWVVPEADPAAETLFAASGIHGLYLIRLVEASDFYLDPGLTEELVLPDGMATPVNESSIQVRAYWWKKMLKDIHSIGNYRNVAFNEGACILTSSPDLVVPQTPAEVFDADTYLPMFQPSPGGGLTLGGQQKGVVVLDNSMALLSSQVPVLPSDSRLAPLLSGGMKDGAAQANILPQPTARVDGGADAEIQRWFGLTGVPVYQNTYSDLAGLTSDRGQSGAALADPPVSLLVGHGTASTCYDGGVGMSTHGLDVSGMRGIIDVAPSNVQVVLGDDFPVIVDVVGITYTRYTITVTAEGVIGGAMIRSISFGMAVNNRAYTRFTDHTGAMRHYVFNLLIPPRITLHEFDVINAEIVVVDINGASRTFTGTRPLSVDSGLPSVYGVTAGQRQDGSGVVDIGYNYDGTRELQVISVSLAISRDGGVTWVVPVASAKGDVGPGVLACPGRRITWNPYLDIPGEDWGYYAARVSVVGEGEVVMGDGVSGGFVVSTPAVRAIITLDPEENDRWGLPSPSIKDPGQPFEDISRECRTANKTSSSSSPSSSSSSFSFGVSSSSSSRSSHSSQSSRNSSSSSSSTSSSSLNSSSSSSRSSSSSTRRFPSSSSSSTSSRNSSSSSSSPSSTSSTTSSSSRGFSSDSSLSSESSSSSSSSESSSSSTVARTSSSSSSSTSSESSSSSLNSSSSSSSSTSSSSSSSLSSSSSSSLNSSSSSALEAHFVCGIQTTGPNFDGEYHYQGFYSAGHPVYSRITGTTYYIYFNSTSQTWIVADTFYTFPTYVWFSTHTYEGPCGAYTPYSGSSGTLTVQLRPC